jgi:hypothetical protein
MSSYGWYGSAHPDVTVWQSPKHETIYAKSYLNETVELDGKLFDHGHFENVKLMYHGFGPVSSSQSDFKEAGLLRKRQYRYKPDRDYECRPRPIEGSNSYAQLGASG